MGFAEKLLQPFFGKKRYYQFWQKVYKASLMGMNVGNGGGYEHSGEDYVMQHVREHVVRGKTPVLFDVGANTGGYARELIRNFGECEIHCFEPAKKTFDMLSDNLKSHSVILNNFGIGSACSEGVLYLCGENSGLASMYERQCFDEDVRTEKICIRTIDGYCEESDINDVHFMKMDIEGNELQALKGAQRMIRLGKIHAIQLEFGGCNLDSRTFFRDFWNLLHEHYRVYRVLLDGLAEVTEYGDILEIFFCTNYLFVSKNVA